MDNKIVITDACANIRKTIKGSAFGHLLKADLDVIETAATLAPQVLTVDELSQHIELWRFDDTVAEKFGGYLMRKFPHGICIIPNQPQQAKY